MTLSLHRGLAAALLSATLLVSVSAASAETTIRRGNGGEPQTLDQAHISIDVEGFVVRDLFEGLTIYDPTGKVVPGTAESWTVSDDGTVYTFKIRENAKWSNGDPVTADDFVYSWTRLLNPDEAAEYAFMLHPVKGAKAYNTKTGDVAGVGLKAIDAKTLEVTLERPTPYFLQLATHYTAIPVHKGNIEQFGKDFTKPGNMISNGAYVLTGFVAGGEITAAKNPNYWDAANVKIDKVVYTLTEDMPATQRMFEAGELDVVYQFQADQLDFLTEKLGADQIKVAPNLATYYYVFDNRTPPFDDVRVRTALSMAVDRDFLSEKIFTNSYLPSYAFVPPGMEGYTPVPVEWSSMDQLDREDKAKELLKEAGYGEGGKPLKIDIRYNTSENHKKVATAVADMWKAIGVEVTMQNLDVKSHYAYLQEGGIFQVARAGWAADYADPENFLSLLTSENATFNYGHWKNADYDALMKQSYAETDPAKRMEVLQKAEALMAKEQPVSPFLNNGSLWLVNRKVKGFENNAVNEHLTKYLSIE
ncbi:peptide ABC transporter substrate-binding protein [Chthonobacter albigriseus]|uniref:peptide ABC transporter substrate-binding protein n=1 Tax=Chthonobacter albigriseus TaxID=1683161 RepID=UPI0015EED61E|nr:peptide ABC transporter substrate-binding protein [Chthonobacter albigriseus]